MTRLLVLLATLLTALPARADQVTIAISRSLPPYVIPEEKRGLEYDIVREALALAGHDMVSRFMPEARVVKEMEAGRVDGVMSVRPASGIKGFYSDPHVIYHNYAITLARANLSIRGVRDLSDKSVMAFRDAATYLGPEYQAAVAHNPRYVEEDNQSLQPMLLFFGRTQVVVADRSVFWWFAHSPEVQAKADTTQELVFLPLFPPTEHYVAFRTQALCDSFNRGLKKLRESGGYDSIVRRYEAFLKGGEP